MYFIWNTYLFFRIVFLYAVNYKHLKNNDIKTNENIRKITTGQGDDYTVGCLLDYLYFKENYKMIAVN